MSDVEATMRMNQRRGLQTIWECLLVTGIGTVLALMANALHPSGVRLGRDYFPRRTPPTSSPVVTSQPAAASPAEPNEPEPTPVQNGASAPALDRAAERIEQQGLQVMRHDEVVALFKDPLTRGGYNIFIDARNDEAYTAGHIPGAYQLDHYHIEDYIDQVLPACMSAMTIVVYCGGGQCEDSEFAALELFDRGVDPSRLFVYPGGMSLWEQSGLPIEKHSRGSGRIIEADAPSPDTSNLGESP